MVSMKDIALACGVSVATVSKALNNHDDISLDTKEIVRNMAKELGYYPNSLARALKTNRSYNLGVLFVDEAQSGLTHDFFAHVLDSFKVTAEENGYDITFLNCSKKRENRMSYLEHCKYRCLDGVVIACIDFNDPEVLELVHSSVPIVTIDYIFNNKTAIMSDNQNGMKQLLTYVINQGHRRIAYIHGADSSVTRSRLHSFYSTLEEHEITIPPEYVRESQYRDTKGAGIVTEELLAIPHPPSCILYPDDFACFGGIATIHQNGLQIPQDISVAGYDGIRIGSSIEPPLTTLRQDTKRLGQCAAEKLISHIEKPKTTFVEHIVIPGEVFFGGSVAVYEEPNELTK